MDEYENTEDQFLGFDSGTPKWRIWKWFDDNYPTGLKGLMADAREQFSRV